MTDIRDDGSLAGLGKRPVPKITTKITDAEAAEIRGLVAMRESDLGKDARAGNIEVAPSALVLVEPPAKAPQRERTFREQLALENGGGAAGTGGPVTEEPGDFWAQLERERQRDRQAATQTGSAPVKETKPKPPEPKVPTLSFRDQLARERALGQTDVPAPVEAPPTTFEEQKRRENAKNPIVVPQPKPVPKPPPPPPAPPEPPKSAPKPPEDAGSKPASGLSETVSYALADFEASDPAAYAKMIKALRDGGPASLPLGGTIRQPAARIRMVEELSDAELLTRAFEDKIGVGPTAGDKNNTFGQKYQRLNELLADDPDARHRLAKLLVTGALSNVGDAGEPLIDSLLRLADGKPGARPKADPRNDEEALATMTAAFADPEAVGALIKRLTPAADDLSPRAMFARSNPGEYAQIVADLALVGNSVVARQMTYGNDYWAKFAIDDAAAKGKDLVAYTVDLDWLQDDQKLAKDPRYQGVMAALGDQPEARAALELLAKTGKLSDKGYYEVGGYSEWNKTYSDKRASVLGALEKLADPNTPLAEGIDRAALLAEVVQGLATPYPTINQGEWQTCTVATIQRLYAEHRPEEYIRVITGLASPEGKVRLAEGKGAEISRPADWEQSVGDNRTTANRLFQSAMIGAAVSDYNKKLYDQAGFPTTAAETATYDNADDSWVDPFGNLRRGLPPEGVKFLASQLEGREYASVSVPPSLKGLITPDLIAKAVLAFPDRKTSSGISNVPMTLELTAADGTKYLHEVLLGNMTKGPPPMATLIDPSDGKTRQMEVATLAKSISSLAFKKEDLEHILERLGTGEYDGFMGSYLEKTGSTGNALLQMAAPWLLKTLVREDAKGLQPAPRPDFAPTDEQLAPILAQLAGEKAPVAKFALHDLIQADALNQKDPEGQRLLADLQAIASGEIELPEGMTKYDALAMMLLDVADDVADKDAGGTRGRRFIPDAGGTRGRRFIPDAGDSRGARYLADAGGGQGDLFLEDAGGTRGRRFIPDAGGTRGRRFIPDAGGGGQGAAAEYSD